MKLLVIEDEKELSDSIVLYLSSENYLCEQAFTYADALEKVNVYDYDCVLLDLMLPGGTGWTSSVTSGAGITRQVSSSFPPRIPLMTG